jgi:hypothetical protein
MWEVFHDIPKEKRGEREKVGWKEGRNVGRKEEKEEGREKDKERR